MKTLTSFLFLFLLCGQLNAQNLYPVLAESYKHVNYYAYDSEISLKEDIDSSIKLNKRVKNNLKIISTALMAAGFKFDNVNDTILIVTNYSDSFTAEPPASIFAKSSKSVSILLNRDLLDNDSFECTKYIDMGLEREYSHGYSSIRDIDTFREFYNSTMMGVPEQDNENFYSLMYHGKVEAFKEFYINKIGRAFGILDYVLRVVIKDGKVVPPMLEWRY